MTVFIHSTACSFIVIVDRTELSTKRNELCTNK